VANLVLGYRAVRQAGQGWRISQRATSPTGSMMIFPIPAAIDYPGHRQGHDHP
jgi:hypothetical protein